jgi:hypothetical protein
MSLGGKGIKVVLLNNVADNKELFLILISAEAGGRAV